MIRLKLDRISPHGCLGLMAAIGLAILFGLSPYAKADDDLSEKKQKSAEPPIEKIELDKVQRAGAGHSNIAKARFKIFRNDSEEDLESPPTHLSLIETKIKPKDLVPIVEIPSLRTIYMTSCGLTDKHFARLGVLKNIEILTLRDNALTDKGLSQLEGWSNLESLSLTKNQINGDGFEHLVKLKHLKKLFLYHNPITDQHLVHIAKMKNLEMIGLAHTPITDEGLKQLAQLKKLKYVSLLDTKVSDKAASEFKKQFPECEVEHKATLGLK